MENNNIKISIIMPVYKVEKYLKRAVESVLSSTFDDFELFLVDDGSPDNSGAICDEYKSKDSRVKVIHQKNSGAHVARNNALKEAKGEYICFFDSDDYIEKDMLKNMYELAKKDDLDLLVSGFCIETYYNDNDFIILDYIPKENTYKDKNSFRKESFRYFDINMFYPPWNKIYKKSYLDNNNIVFPLTYRDDFPFVMAVIKDIEKIGFTSKEYYHFIRKREESETQKYVPTLYEKRLEEHDNMTSLFKYWGLDKDKNSLDMIGRRYVDRIVECMVNLYNKESRLTENEKNTEIYKYLHDKNIDEALKHARPRKLYLKIMYMPIRLKNVSLCKIMAKFIANVKSKNVKIFSYLKKNR